MRINNNIMAMNTHRQLGINNQNVAKATERLSSGYRVNRAGDDAAGLAISEKMRAQIKGLNMASKNSQDAISLIQTAEGALTETHSILQRMRELAVQSSSDTNETTIDRAALEDEFTVLSQEIDDIAEDTAFNSLNLLNGSLGRTTTEDTDVGNSTALAVGEVTGFTVTGQGWEGGAVGSPITHEITIDINAAGDAYDIGYDDGSTAMVLTDALSDTAAAGTATFDFGDGKTLSITNIQLTDDSLDGTVLQFDVENGSAKIQAGANEGETVNISISAMDATTLGVDTSINGGTLTIADGASAEAAITTVNDAINTVSSERSQLGAMQNRLQHKINNLDTSAENLQAAESRIRDLDMAKEMTEFTKNNILVQAATSMLAQANAAPQGVLSLLQ